MLLRGAEGAARVGAEGFNSNEDDLFSNSRSKSDTGVSDVGMEIRTLHIFDDWMNMGVTTRILRYSTA